MKRTLSLCIFFVLLSTIGHPQQQVSMSEARIVAVNTMRYNRQMYSETDIDTIQLYISGIDTMLYEVKFNDNHSVLLSGSKACQPILGYNFSYDDETALDKFDEIPPGLQFMIQEYIDQIELCFANDTITLWHAADWANLMTYSKYGNEVNDVVSPLITTKWGQDISNDDHDCHAYNHYIYSTDNSCNCSGDDHCPAGCTAVAMAQIMNYWKCPVYHALYGPNQFDWCNMPDQLMTNSANYDKERESVARLIQKCGDRINTRYCVLGTCNSLAWPSNVREALVETYQYSSAADYQLKASHNINTWIGRMKNNLNNNQPILYAGGSLTDGGHSFVCDGYRSDNTFNFNWGWRGSYNNYWLTVNDLTVAGYNFNSLQQAVFYIYPANNDDYCHISSSLENYFGVYRLLDTVSTAAPKIFDTLVSINCFSSLNPKYRTIAIGQSIEYVAHKKVKLIDGFTAEEGSHFTAYIDECEKCEEQNLGERYNNANEKQQETSPVTMPLDVESDVEQEMYIIPNPNNGSFYISFSDNEQDIINVRVIDAMGKTVYSNNRFAGGEIVLPNSKSGMYCVSVTLKDKTITKKIIIK